MTTTQTSTSTTAQTSTTAAQTTTFDVVVFGPNLNSRARETFHVHAAGCADCKKYGPGRTFGGDADSTPLTVRSKEQVVAIMYADIIAEREDQPAEEATEELFSEFLFASCCKMPKREKAPKAVRAPEVVTVTEVKVPEVVTEVKAQMTFEDACNLMCDFRATEEQVAQASAILNGRL